MAEHQEAGHQEAGHQEAGYREARYQVASCGGWGAGLGSGVDTRSQYHSPDCQSPETFDPGGCPTALPRSAIPPPPLLAMRGKGCLLDQWSSSGSLDPEPSLHPPPWDSGRPCPVARSSQGSTGPLPCHPPTEEVPALSTPGCVGSYSHLPAEVGLGVVNHQLQGLPLVGLDECKEVLGLRQSQRLSPTPSTGIGGLDKTRPSSWTAPTSTPYPGGLGRANQRSLTSWRIWSEPTT